MNRNLIILISAVVIASVFWFFMVFQPVNSETNRLKTRLAELVKKEKEIVTAADMQRIRSEVDSLFTRLDEDMKRLYPEEQLLDLGRRVEEIGREYGLKLVSIVPDYESLSLFSENRGDISELPVTIGFKGSFTQFSRFLDSIPEFPLVLRVNEVNLENTNGNHSQLSIQLRGIVVLRKERVNEEEKTEIVTSQT